MPEKYPYSELFSSIVFRIWTEYEEILRIYPYSVRMLENTDQKNTEYKHFLRRARHYRVKFEQTNPA